jgi:hypothetical protein
VSRPVSCKSSAASRFQDGTIKENIMANDQNKNRGDTGDVSEDEVREALGREEQRQKKADDRLVDQMNENRNVSGSTTFETLAEEEDQ